MRVEVIVVKYNQPEYEARTIEAVARHTKGVDYTLTAYQNEKGVGLAKCWNDLVRRSNADYICLLNSDTVPAKKWLELLLKTFHEWPECGAVVPSSNDSSGCSINVPFSHAVQSFDSINDFATGWRDQVPGSHVELDVLSATCLVFPKSVWAKANGFDEDFFLYGEDSEFTWRIKNKLGFQLLWRRDAYVHHYKAQSVNKAVAAGEFNYAATRAEATRLWRLKTGKDPETGETLQLHQEVAE